MRTRNPLLTLLALLLGAPVAAAPNPATVAVSPGGAGTVELAGSACPTFSWSAAAGATGYELVAYALDPGGETGAEPALRVALPAGVTSWSPSGSQCLAPGRSFAWVVRSTEQEGTGEWSAARFFRVPDRPSVGAVREALTVLRRHVAEEDPEAARLLAELAATAVPELEEEPAAAPANSRPSPKATSSAIVVNGEPVITGLVTFGDWAQNGCSGDQVPKWSGAAWTCADDLGGGPASDVVCVGCVGATDLADGSGSGVDADLLDGQEAADFASTSHQHFGTQWDGNEPQPGLEVINDGGTGIQGVTSSSSNHAGVFGRSTSSDSKAIWGLNSATTSTAIGVFGETLAPDGRGVSGLARSTTGGAPAVYGQAHGETGVGVDGWATHASGSTAGVRGISSSPAGAGGFFVNSGNGLLIAANDNFSFGDLELSVDADGNVVAGSFTGDGSGLTNLPAGDADTLDGVDSTGFAAAGHDHGGETWSLNLADTSALRVHNQGSGASSGVHGSSTSSSGVGVRGESTALSGSTAGVQGTVQSPAGIGVFGYADSTSDGIGVLGQSVSPDGQGVVGSNTAPTGTAIGVEGQTASTSGRAVWGNASAPTGTTVGVDGSSASTGGRGVWGRATATSGTTQGVYGWSRSPDGTGGLFVNSDGGNLITGNDSTSLADPAEFVVAADGSVTAAGTVTAAAFVGDGSGLTNLPAADAQTLDGFDSSSFLRSDASSAVTAGVLGFETGTALDVHKATLQVGAMTKTGNGLVANLNADQLDGLDAAAFASSGHQHFGEAWSGSGIRGLAISNTSSAAASFGILGKSLATSGTTIGVVGDSDSPRGIGVYGVVDESDPSSTAIGVLGQTAGTSGASIGVKGEAFSPDAVAVYGEAQSDGAVGGFFVNTGSGDASSRIVLAAGGDTDQASLEFKVMASGDVYADGTYNCGPNLVDLNASGDLSEIELDPCLRDSSPADFAEMLPLAAPGAEPGDVLAVDRAGRLVPTRDPYQVNVVGVRSTRPSYLGNSRFAGDAAYTPLAISGLVPVKVTAENGPVRPGDLLVSSSTPGHAMRADDDPPQGTVVGKALEGLTGDRGKVLMLATLQ